MALAIDYDTCKPLTMIIPHDSPHDTKIFDDMMNELKKRGILKKTVNII
jgi:hypothetical protein